jgi:glutamate-1-semialdehyde aminotransferase
MFGSKTHALQERARNVMPLGVNSNFRYWGEGITPYVEKAKGAYLWDVDGKKYIDYRMAFGPIILGHSYDEVDQKVIEEIQKGILFAMTGSGNGPPGVLGDGSDHACHPGGTGLYRARYHPEIRRQLSWFS